MLRTVLNLSTNRVLAHFPSHLKIRIISTGPTLLRSSVIDQDAFQRKKNPRDDWLNASNSKSKDDILSASGRFDENTTDEFANELSSNEGFDHLPDTDGSIRSGLLHHVTQKWENNRDPLIRQVLETETLSSLLDLIDSSGIELSPDQQEVVYTQMNILCHVSRFRKHAVPNESAVMTHREFRDIAKTSPVFRSLLETSFTYVRQLSTGCLLAILKTSSLLSLDPSSKLSRAVMIQLRHDVHKMDFLEVCKCLHILQFYSSNTFFKASQGIRLQSDLFTHIENWLLSPDFVRKNITAIIHFINVFRWNQNILQSLIDELAAPEITFNYKQALFVLKNLIMKDFRLELRTDKIVEKCHNTIYDYLKDNLSIEKMHYYCNLLHRTVIISNRGITCDPRLFDLFVPLMLEETSPVSNFFLFNFATNFSLAYAYDKRLLEYIYEKICTDHDFILRNCDTKLLFILKYKLSFVDPNRIADVYMANSDLNFNINFRNPRTNLRILNDLILSETSNVDFLDRISNTISNTTRSDLKKMSYQLNRMTHLSIAYLSTLSNLNTDSKKKLLRKLRSIMDKFAIVNDRELIDNVYTRINPKIQKNAYLSNGVLLDSIVIYDRDTKDLVPFTDEHIDYFHKIDKLPLKENQELLTFVTSIRLQGNIEQCETYYNHQLCRILESMNIKPIIVYLDDFGRMSINQRIDFLIRKALKSCRS